MVLHVLPCMVLMLDLVHHVTKRYILVVMAVSPSLSINTAVCLNAQKQPSIHDILQLT